MPKPKTPTLAALSIALGLAACGGSSPSGRPAPSLPHRTTSDLVTAFEDEQALKVDPAGALATFQRLGADVVRVYVPWDHLAPDPTTTTAPSFAATDPAAYPAAGWTYYDQIVRAAAARNLTVDLDVGEPPPLWAAGPGAPRGSIHADEWKPSAHDYGAFVQALGTRYSGHYVPPGATAPLPHVAFWSIWNEPNYGPYLAPQAINHSTVEVSPALYRGLLDAAWNGLEHSGHTPGRDTILIGETAPRGIVGGNHPGNFSGMVPLRFVRALYCLGADLKPLTGATATARACPATAAQAASFKTDHPALFEAGGFADHPYPDALAPSQATPGEPDYADFAAIPNLEKTLDSAFAAYHASGHLQIYNTEFGYRVGGPAGTVSGAAAAAYMNQAEYLSWRDRRIGSYDQYQLVDVAGSDFTTALEYLGGKPKPTLDAFRMPLWLPVISAPKAHASEVWGCVRPAPYYRRQTGRSQQVVIEFAATGSSRFEPVRRVTLTDPHGYFDVLVRFPGSGRVRLAWSGAGAHFHSRTQAIVLR